MPVSKEEREQIQESISRLEDRLNILNERQPNGANKEKEKLKKQINDEKKKLEEKVRVNEETKKLSPEEKEKKKKEHEKQLALAKAQQLGIKAKFNRE